MMSSCMTSLNSYQCLKLYLRDRKLLHIYAICRTLSLVNLCSIPVDAKLICKHKGLIPDSNVKACQPI